METRLEIILLHDLPKAFFKVCEYSSVSVLVLRLHETTQLLTMSNNFAVSYLSFFSTFECPFHFSYLGFVTVYFIDQVNIIN